jgi:pimeloyl-ACP methyl ester carboxylesterase
MAIIDIRGVQHTYDLTPPTTLSHVLVFIHGWLLSREYWHPLIEQLSATYQCLSYDLRGFGQSKVINPKQTLGYSPMDYAADLSVLLRELNIDQAWLVGHSLGGTVALWAAHQFPDIVQGVVCLNSGGGIYLKEEFERFRAIGTQIVKFRPFWLSYLPFLNWLFARASVAKPLPQRWGKQRVMDLLGADAEAALRSLLDSTTEAEVHLLPKLVAQLKQPTYFIAGMQDTVMEPKYVRHLASFHWMFSTNHVNLFELADCGHMSMIEQTEQVATRLKDLLTRVP